MVYIGVFSEGGALKYGELQGFILGPLFFLLHVTDLPQSFLEDDSYLTADNTCIFHLHENVEEIENVLKQEFSSLCPWFIDNKMWFWKRQN